MYISELVKKYVEDFIIKDEVKFFLECLVKDYFMIVEESKKIFIGVICLVL